jgi:hypothetical protein
VIAVHWDSSPESSYSEEDTLYRHVDNEEGEEEVLELLGYLNSNPLYAEWEYSLDKNGSNDSGDKIWIICTKTKVNQRCVAIHN